MAAKNRDQLQNPTLEYRLPFLSSTGITSASWLFRALKSCFNHVARVRLRQLSLVQYTRLVYCHSVTVRLSLN